MTRLEFEKVLAYTEEDRNRKWVIYGSAEFIDAINNAIEEEIKKMMIMPNETEQKVIELREEGMSYHAIQLALGNPSKKFIKDTLRKFRPELAGDVVKNYGRLR